MAKKNKQTEEIKKTFFKNINFKYIYFFLGLIIIFNIFLTLKVFNLEKKILPLIAQQEAKKPKEIKINDVKKLFAKGFIHFGDASKKLLFVEISDPSCPFCHIASGHNPQLAAQVGDRFKYQSDGGSYIPPVLEMKKLVDQGKASFAFIYSNGHGNGIIATQALYCAYEKGKFWEIHDKLMTNEGYNLINEQVKNDKTKIPDLVSFLAKEIDQDFLTKCLESGRYEKNLARDQQLSPSLGFQGTPHFLINTQMFQGAYSFSDMKPVIDKYL